MGDGLVSLVLLALVAVVAALTLIWTELRPAQAERTYKLFEGGRKIGAAIFLIVFSLTALQSGRWYLIVAALLAIAAAALYVGVERPDRRLT